MAKDDFNAEAIRRKLDSLEREGSLAARREELLKPWPDMRSDVRVIYDELAFELRKNGTVRPFLKSMRFDGDKFLYEMPDWWHEARRRFSELYKAPEDEVRFEKAFTVFSEQLFLQFEERSDDTTLDELNEALAEFDECAEIQTGTA